MRHFGPGCACVLRIGSLRFLGFGEHEVLRAEHVGKRMLASPNLRKACRRRIYCRQVTETARRGRSAPTVYAIGRGQGSA